MIILDTNVVSEMLRPQPDAGVAAWLSAQDGAQVHLTAVTEAELRYGIALLPQGRRRDDLAEAMRAILTEVFRNRILPFDSAAADLYAAIGANRRAAGRPISQFDCQIAAIARLHGATLATRNTADFADCGIAIVDPWRQSSTTFGK